VQLAHGVTVEQDCGRPAGLGLFRERREMRRHLPAGEVEELLRAVREVLTEVWRAPKQSRHVRTFQMSRVVRELLVAKLDVRSRMPIVEVIDVRL
jgi:hypothetical protein